MRIFVIALSFQALHVLLHTFCSAAWCRPPAIKKTCSRTPPALLRTFSKSKTNLQQRDDPLSSLSVSNPPFTSNVGHSNKQDDNTNDAKPNKSLPTNSPATAITFSHATDFKSSTSQITYPIHKGRATDMIKRCVSVEGLSLSTGWTPQATRAFEIAVEAVVRTNPILTGKLVDLKTTPWPWDRGELHVVPNAFPPESHSFVAIVKPPTGMDSPSEVLGEISNEGKRAKELFQYVHSYVAPSMLDKPDFTFEQIRNASPLFEAKMMDFGDGHAAYSIKMSHAIGDGTTFFQIVSQISSYMNGRDPSPIEWNNPLKATHEIYPENFSERDYNRSYGISFGWGLLKNLRTLKKRQCEYLLLSKDKIAQKRRELRRSVKAEVHSNSMSHNSIGGNSCTSPVTKTRGEISANDIIMSAICEMNDSSDLFAFDRSVRGIKEGVGKSAAGNFFWEIPFEKEKGKVPNEIRDILSNESGSYFGTNGVPLLPFLNGRVGRITSLASITHETTFPGSQVVCQFPSASFIRDLPLDVAVIFRFDKNHYGIMHNFRKVNNSPLLDEIKV